MDDDVGAADREDLRVARSFEEMFETDGWKNYVDKISRMIESKLADLLNADTQIPSLIAGERAKGAIAALKAALALPHVTVQQAAVIRKSLAADDEEED